MNKIDQLKQRLARVFDDDLNTSQWHNWVDYFIIGLILLSTAVVFISTFNIPPEFEKALHYIDLFTLFVFTIEVSLRIWTADIINPKYKGFWGRVKYCFSFYGLIDVLSTYPFYLTFWVPIPYNILKVLRIARLLRIFRYMKSFRLLTNAISSKKNEMLISLQFLVIVTLILSFILFFFEHRAQPDVYDNGMSSVIWAFAQYIGDPGGFADTPPITYVGRIIACFIGVLGIAIFAVPAGLIGAGFTEAIEDEEKRQTIERNTEKLKIAFQRKLDRYTGFQVAPPYLSFVEIQARIGMTTDDIFDVVEKSPAFRMINLASTVPVEERMDDKLAIEHFVLNRSYGVCIDRQSMVTIVSPSSMVDPIIYYFAYYVAKIGGFNFVSREIGEQRPYKSYYLIDERDSVKGLEEYLEDIERLSSNPNSWIITLLAASGQNEPTYSTQFHFGIGGKKGDETCDGENLVVKDITKYNALYSEFSQYFETKYGLTCDHQRFHDTSNKRLFIRKLNNHSNVNAIMLRVAWSVTCWDSRRIAIAKSMAEIFSRHLDPNSLSIDSPELMQKGVGFNDYTN